MRQVSLTALFFSAVLLGQTRVDLAKRFGPPQSEVFVLPHNLKVTATYDREGAACTLRIETQEHSVRTSPDLTDAKFWTDSAYVSELISNLMQQKLRQGKVESRSVGLRVGEQMIVESDDAVEISRIQRSRPLVNGPDLPMADRLVRIVFKRPACTAKAR